MNSTDEYIIILFLNGYSQNIKIRKNKKLYEVISKKKKNKKNMKYYIGKKKNLIPNKNDS